MSKEGSKKKGRQRSTRIPMGVAGLFSTLGEKGRGFSIKPIVVIIASLIFIASSIILLILKI